MKSVRLLGTALLGVVIGVAVSCESSNEGSGGAADFCPSLEGYVSPCDDANVCEQALARDCDPLSGVVNADFATATAECMNMLGQPQDCMADATRASTSSPRVEAFATAICLECGSGAGDCEDEVLDANDDTELGRAGRLARILTADALEAVQDECTTGENCAASFESCAKQVLARDVPDESATCLVDAAFDNYDTSCGGDSTTGLDTDGSDTDQPGTNTFPTDPTDATTNPTDPTDPTSETDGDTEDLCDEVGCACMFNEDCAGELICPEGTCEEPTSCEDDPFEPNNGEIQATLLPPITDDDDQGDMLTGELEAAQDIDWFRYEGDDTALAIVGPYAQVNVNALELCIYAECLNGLENTDVSCNEGTTLQPSPNGRPGCCGSNTSGFEISLSCGGTFSDDSAQIFMSVTGSDPGVCQEYTLSYHF